MTRALVPVSQDSLAGYLREVGRYPTLTPAEERALAERWREHGDVEAARALVLSNLRFVVRVAREYRGYGFRMMELVQEGNVGLMVAVKRFDPKRGIRLLSYAVWWIRAYMLAYIMRSWRLVRLGTTRAQRKLFYRLRQVQNRLRLAGTAAEPERVGRATGTTAGEVVEMDSLLGGRDVSFDTPLGGDSERTVGDLIAAPQESPEEAVAASEARGEVGRRLEVALATLDPRERELVRRRYLADDAPALADVAREQGVSRERMRQIEARALRKLRERLPADTALLALPATPVPAVLARAA